MHAIHVTQTGGPDVLKYKSLSDPEPGEDQILVKSIAAGVNFIDIYRREGRYPQPEPRIPGEEGSGIVLSVGPNVTEYAPGDRVAWTTVLGSYATKVVVPVDKAIKVPESIDMLTAAGVLVQGMTAHYLINSSYLVKPNDKILVHAAAGGVGSLLVQMVKARGATVIATVSNEEKKQFALKNGADHVIRYDLVTDFSPMVRELTGGLGVNAVYDGVGVQTYKQSLASLRKRGTLILFGGASGPVPPIDVMELAWGGSLTLTRPYLEHFRETKEEFHWRANDVFNLLMKGQLKLHLDGTFPLAQASEAHRALASRKTKGKLILTTEEV